MAINLISVWVLKGETQYRSTNRFWTVGVSGQRHRPEDGDSSGSRKAGRVSVLLVSAFADMGPVDYGQLCVIRHWFMDRRVPPEFGNDS